MTHEEASNDLKRVQTSSHSKKRHHQKQRKRQKKGRKEDKECGVTVKNAHPMYPWVNVKLPNFRYMILSEVESRARAVHDYYAKQWCGVLDDRFRSYVDLHRSLEREKRLGEKLQQALEEIHQQRKENENLKTEIENIKKSRKQRRKDAKLQRMQDLQVKDEQTELDLIREDQIQEKLHEEGEASKGRNKNKADDHQRKAEDGKGGFGEGSKKKRRNRKRRKNRAEKNGGTESDILEPHVEKTEKAEICHKQQQDDSEKPEINSFIQTAANNDNEENGGLENNKLPSVVLQKIIENKDKKSSSEKHQTMEDVITKMIETLSKSTGGGGVKDEEGEGTFYSGEPAKATLEPENPEKKPPSSCTSRKMETGNGDENTRKSGNGDENMATAVLE
ncbi:uncharacterized protein LOC134241874 [Saccostrea cucullata]|uniref:uncharacterized protein LOC134241874 n=1 Tax=Saccostrea cuccullata TaxID=36930 RepID=UPI002ED2DF78